MIGLSRDSCRDLVRNKQVGTLMLTRVHAFEGAVEYHVHTEVEIYHDRCATQARISGVVGKAIRRPLQFAILQLRRP